MSRVFIGIGSNEGDRLRSLSRAIDALSRVDGIRVIQMAVIQETEPVGGPPQDPYLNTAIEVDTNFTPITVLRVLKTIEQQLGRQPSTQRWGPRAIDLDLLLYDEQMINTPELVVPHPRLHERRFVLEPLVQLAPELIHPVLKRSIAELLNGLPHTVHITTTSPTS